MKRFLFLLVLIPLFFSCSSPWKSLLENDTAKFPKPPGTVKVSDNFYIDNGELTNISWKEYQYWMKSIFGNDSDQYQATLLDTLVWRDKDISYGEPLISNYFTHPAYMEYPVVGMTYEQALAYSKWRSDRVFQQALIGLELITADIDDSITYFTIEKYFNGDYKGVRPNYSIPYPTYRLPTKAEWIAYAYGYMDKSGVDDKKVKKYLKNDMPLYNTSTLSGGDSTYSSYTAPSISFLPNDFKLYNTVGNVSEMIAEKGISKGGSFIHQMEDCKIGNDIPYKKPTYWLGFRNVCEWKYWKE